MALLRQLRRRITQEEGSIPTAAVRRRAPVASQPEAEVQATPAMPRRARGRAVETDTPRFHSEVIVEALRQSDAAPQYRRDGSYHHVSSLMKECPRMVILNERADNFRPDYVRGQTLIMWKMGRTAELHVREALIAHYGMENVKGSWHCKCEKTRRDGYGLTSATCQTCGGPVNIYAEKSIRDSRHNIRGSPDMLLRTTAGLTLIECKSMVLHTFKELIIQKPEHSTQAGCYVKLLELEENNLEREPVNPVAIIIYVAKDFDFKVEPYKEYHVDTRNGMVPTTVEMVWDAAVQINSAKQSKVLLPPKLSACQTAQSTKAKNCSACVLCFSTNQ